MPKNLWIIANWKSHKNVAESLEWLRLVVTQTKTLPHVRVVVCPSFTALAPMRQMIGQNQLPLFLGAQSISSYDEGAYTGEVAAKQLQGLAQMTIIGHSERRNLFHETDQELQKKVELALDSQIMPIFCVQNENTIVPNGVSLIAYEPVFAIGSGNSDTAENANSVATSIKNKLQRNVEVLYGGSVTENNAAEFLKQEYISGLLIGGASLSPQSFVAIIQASSNIN